MTRFLNISSALLFCLLASAASGKPLCLNGTWDIQPLALDGEPRPLGAWQWDPSMPLEGFDPHRSDPEQPFSEHSYKNGPPLLIGGNGIFRQAILLDAEMPPSAIAFRFHILGTDTWTAWAAYSVEGKPLPSGFAVEHASPIQKLVLPGHWAKIEASLGADSAGLKGQYLDGMAFAVYGGRAWWGPTELTDDNSSGGNSFAVIIPGSSQDPDANLARYWQPEMVPVPGTWCNPSAELGGDDAVFSSYNIPKEYNRFDEVLLRTVFDPAQVIDVTHADTPIQFRFGGMNHSGTWRINESPWFETGLPYLSFRTHDIRQYLKSGRNELFVRLRRCPRNKEGSALHPCGTTWAQETGGILGDVYIEEYQPLAVEDVHVDVDWETGKCVLGLRPSSSDKALQAGAITIRGHQAASPITPLWKGRLPSPGEQLSAVIELDPGAVKPTPWSPDSPTPYGFVISVTPEIGRPYRFVRSFGWNGLRRQENGSVELAGKPIAFIADQWDFLGAIATQDRYITSGFRILKNLGANTVHLRGMPFTENYYDLARTEGVWVLADTADLSASPENVRDASYLAQLKAMRDEFAWRLSGNPAVLWVGPETEGSVSPVSIDRIEFTDIFPGFDAFDPIELAWRHGESAIGKPADYYRALGAEWTERILWERARGTPAFKAGPLVATLVKPVPEKDTVLAASAKGVPGWSPARIAAESLTLPPGFDVIAEASKRNPLYDEVAGALRPLGLSFLDAPRSVWAESTVKRRLLLVHGLPVASTPLLKWTVRNQQNVVINKEERIPMEPFSSKVLTLEFAMPQVFDMRAYGITASITGDATGPGVLQERFNLVPDSFRRQKMVLPKLKVGVFGRETEAELVLNAWFPNLTMVQATPEEFRSQSMVFILPRAVQPDNGEAVKTAVQAALGNGVRVIFLAQDYLPDDLYPGSGIIPCATQIISSAETHEFLTGLSPALYSKMARTTPGFLTHGLRRPTQGRFLSFLDTYEPGPGGRPDLSAALRVSRDRAGLFFFQLPVSRDELDALVLFSRFCLRAREQIYNPPVAQALVLNTDTGGKALLDSVKWLNETVTIQDDPRKQLLRYTFAFVDGTRLPSPEEARWLIDFASTGRRLFINAPDPAAGDWTPLLPPATYLESFTPGLPLAARFGLSSISQGISMEDVREIGARTAISRQPDSRPPLIIAHSGWSLGWRVMLPDFTFPAFLDRAVHRSAAVQSLLTYHPLGRGGVIISTLDISAKRLSESAASRVFSTLLTNLDAIPPDFQERMVSSPFPEKTPTPK